MRSPTIEGDFALVADSPLPSRVLGFGSWLEPAEAAKVEEATARLRLAAKHSSPRWSASRAPSSSTGARCPAARSCASATSRASGFNWRNCAISSPRPGAPSTDCGARLKPRTCRHGRATPPANRLVQHPLRTRRRRARRPGRDRKGRRSCSIRRYAAKRKRRSGRPAPGAAARRRSWAASAEASRRSKRARRSAPPELRVTFPKSRRCGRKWNATRTTIRA